MRPVLLMFALGCGSHPPPPATGSGAPHTQAIDAAVRDAGPLDRNLDQLATRGVAMLEDVARAVEAAGEDCKLAATKLGELSTRYADVIAANAKVLRENREMELKLALRRFEDRFQAAAKAIMDSRVLKACWRDDEFSRAFDQLAGKYDVSP